MRPADPPSSARRPAQKPRRPDRSTAPAQAGPHRTGPPTAVPRLAAAQRPDGSAQQPVPPARQPPPHADWPPRPGHLPSEPPTPRLAAPPKPHPESSTPRRRWTRSPDRGYGKVSRAGHGRSRSCHVLSSPRVPLTMRPTTVTKRRLIAAAPVDNRPVWLTRHPDFRASPCRGLARCTARNIRTWLIACVSLGYAAPGPWVGARLERRAADHSHGVHAHLRPRTAADVRRDPGRPGRVSGRLPSRVLVGRPAAPSELGRRRLAVEFAPSDQRDRAVVRGPLADADRRTADAGPERAVGAHRRHPVARPPRPRPGAVGSPDAGHAGASGLRGRDQGPGVRYSEADDDLAHPTVRDTR